MIFCKLEIGDWIDIVNIVLTLILTYIVFYSQRIYSRFQEKRERPHLNFAQTEGEWKLYNFGGGSAVHIRFSEISFDDETKVHSFPVQTVVSYGLPTSTFLKLTYKTNLGRQVITFAHVLVATYKDIHNHEYLLYCRSDTNHVFELKSGKWSGSWEDIDHSELNDIYNHLHTNTTRAGLLELTSI